MKKLYRFVIKLFIIPIPIVFVLIFASVLMLVYSFTKLSESSPFSIISYVLSAYTLITVSCRMKSIVDMIVRFRSNNKYAVRYFSDRDIRVRVSLNIGMIISLAYAVFRIAAGIFYRSFWFGAEAEYYIVLTLMKLWLIKCDGKYQNNPEAMLKCCIKCGVGLLILNFIMSCIMAQVVFRDESYYYNGILIYACAAFTFYRVISSIVQLVRYRSNGNLILSVSKKINLSASLMSLFALQTAMLSAFGSGDRLLGRTANAATAAAVCICVIAMALIMIAGSARKLTKYK